MPYQKVLIAVDSSEHSMKVAEHGVNLSSQLGAKIAIVLVIDTSKVNIEGKSGRLPQEQIAELKREADKIINDIAKQFNDSQFERFLPEGKPSNEIMTIANDWGADLIIMGTQGKTGIKRLLLGSTAENTIRLSNTPILIVPSKS
jgi:nucleotide-binding universal stress UspA family protein